MSLRMWWIIVRAGWNLPKSTKTALKNKGYKFRPFSLLRDVFRPSVKECKPLKRFLGHSWIGWINLLFMQWVFIRFTTGQRLKSGKWVRCYGVLVAVVPLTGWGCRFLGPCYYLPFHKER
jgi:hypothetical protein